MESHHPAVEAKSQRNSVDAKSQSSRKSTGQSIVSKSGDNSVRKTLTNARIGPYIFGKTLGLGSTGRVKLGTHVETGKKVAIKIISKQSLKKDKDPDGSVLQKKLEREIAIMKLVHHPNIMSLYDVYESNEELFLVLELVEGGELFDYLVKRGRLPEMEALRFFQQMMAGLDYCHKHLICHRDLKPENLLLDNNRNIKIADFGMASLQVSGSLLETSCGSPHYASPEIIRGVKYNGSAADIWSCGVILYALLSGTLPFDDENIRRLLQKVKAGVFHMPDSIPSDAADLIRKMLVADPSKRITMSDIEQHPWFTKQPYTSKAGDGPLRNPPTPDAFRPFTDEDVANVDADIVATLKTLGYGTEENIIRALRASESNYEKVFYWLLLQRKTEYLENYEPEQEWWYDESNKTPRRRVNSSGSRNSIYSDRSSVYSSLGGSADLAVSSQQNLKSPENKDDERKRSTADKRRSYNPSPLSSAVVPDDENNPDAAKKAKEAALRALEGDRSPSPSSTSSSQEIVDDHPRSRAGSEGTSRRSLIMNLIKNRISSGLGSPVPETHQSLPTVDNSNDSRRSSAGRGVGNNAFKSNDVVADPGALGTPKFHRKRLDAVPVASTDAVSSRPPSAEHGDLRNLKHQPATVSSPAVSSSSAHASPTNLPSPKPLGDLDQSFSNASINLPKKSWFANLFQFRPESAIMYSKLSLADTRNRIDRRLEIMHVQTQPSKDGISVKCKYDANNTLPAVKFKIILAIDEHSITEIKCIQQLGALATFQHFLNQFKEDWIEK